MSTAALGPALTSAGARAWRGVVWYLRTVSGESRWDDYLARCAAHGHQPVTRREFERERAAAAERRPLNRCC